MLLHAFEYDVISTTKVTSGRLMAWLADYRQLDVRDFITSRKDLLAGSRSIKTKKMLQQDVDPTRK